MPYHWEELSEPFFCIYHGPLMQGCYQTREQAEASVRRSRSDGLFQGTPEIVRFDTHAAHEEAILRMHDIIQRSHRI